MIFRRDRRLDPDPGGLARRGIVGLVRLFGMAERRVGHARSDVEGAAVGVKHGLVHHFRQRRMREDGVASAPARWSRSVLAMA